MLPYSTSQPFGSVEVDGTALYSPAEWQNYPDPEQAHRFDYGAIKLPDPSLGNAIGQYFKYGYFSDDYLLRQIPNISGYPKSKPHELWSALGYEIWTFPQTIAFDADATEGESGGPVWVSDGSSWMVVAIMQSAESDTLNNPWNWGTRITQTVASDLQDWLAPPPETDCQTLTINTSGGGVATFNPPNSAGCPQGFLSHGFAPGTVVTITANPNPGWVFSHWNGASGGATLNYTVQDDATITAIFAQAGGNLAPGTPSNLQPSSGTYTDIPQLCWTGSTDPEDDAVTYQVSVRGSSTYQSAWISGTCITPTGLGPGSYSWNVRAQDEHGAQGGYSTDGSFTITTVTPPSGPAGYSYCAAEGGNCTISGSADVAYGANGSYYYQYNKTGIVMCNNTTFGDPLPNTLKACFYKSRSLPSLTTVSPSSALAGSAGISLSVSGSSFLSSSKVRWNGTDLATTFVNSSNLSAIVPSQYLTSAGIANITVNNPVNNGGDSNPVSFTVTQFTNGCDYIEDFSFSPASPSSATDITIHVKIKSNFPNYRAARLKVVGGESLGEFSGLEDTRVWHTSNSPDGDRSILLEIDDTQGVSWNNPVTCSRSYHLDARPILPPADFGLVSPGSLVSIPQSNIINFEWQASQGANSYRLHLWNGAGLDLATPHQFNTTWKYIAAVPGDYYWQVSAYDLNLQRKDSPVWSFTVTPRENVPTFRIVPAAGNTYSVGQHIQFNVEVDAAGQEANLKWLEAAINFDDTRLRLANITNVTNAETVDVIHGDISISFPGWSWCGSQAGLLAILDFEVMAGGATELSFDWEGPHSWNDWNNIPQCNYGQADLLEKIVNVSFQLSGPEPTPPAPALNSLDPITVIADPLKDQWVHIAGENFYNTSVVRVNGVSVTSTTESRTLIVGKLGPGAIANPGSYTITVYTPGGGTSNALNFTIQAPPDTTSPSLNWTRPVDNQETIVVGNETIQLEASATDNVGITKVHFFRWDTDTLEYVDVGDVFSAPFGWDLDTMSLNPGWNEIFAEAQDAAGNVSIPESIWLYRQAPNPVPFISGLDVNSSLVGSGDTMISIIGSGFYGDSVVRWNGLDLEIPFVNDQLLIATIPASELTETGVASITVFNPGPGGGTSNPVPFTVIPNGVCVPNYQLSLGSLDTWSNDGPGSTQQVDGYSVNAWNESGPEYTYVFYPTESVSAHATLGNLASDLDLFVIEDTGNGCRSDHAIAVGDSEVTFSAFAGHAYYLVVDGYAGSVGNYTISLTGTALGTDMPGDDIDSPLLIGALPFSLSLDATPATSAIDDPAFTDCNRAPGAATVWVEFTPQMNGTLVVDTVGSSYDTILGIWTGARGNLTAVGCNDDISSTSTQSRVIASLAAYTTYHIEVAQYSATLSGLAATEPKPGADLKGLGGGDLWLNVRWLNTTTLYSAGGGDGWILESSETSIKGGALNATSTTFPLGDETGDKQYRAILSFDTSKLPDNAVITGVTLKIKKQGQVGSNPFSMLGGLRVDIRKPYFGISLALVASDFQAALSRAAVGTFGANPVNNWYSAIIGSTGYPYINRTGPTQFRLYFAKDDNDDGGADYMKFFSGNYGIASARPTLVIQHYVP